VIGYANKPGNAHALAAAQATAVVDHLAGITQALRDSPVKI
jgi:hypothetical protein